MDIDGNQNAESLIPRGWQRAGALSEFFASANGSRIAVPQYIYASGVGKHSSSLRPQETITPLAEKLTIRIDTKFLKGQESDVANDAMNRSGIVLISWEHQNIHLIANQILGNTTTSPQNWPGDRFDLVWVFDIQSGSYKFDQVPQQLLSGDRNTIIS